jgi:hypothetical protein
MLGTGIAAARREEDDDGDNDVGARAATGTAAGEEAGTGRVARDIELEGQADALGRR